MQDERRFKVRNRPLWVQVVVGLVGILFFTCVVLGSLGMTAEAFSFMISSENSFEFLFSAGQSLIGVTCTVLFAFMVFAFAAMTRVSFGLLSTTVAVSPAGIEIISKGETCLIGKSDVSHVLEGPKRLLLVLGTRRAADDLQHFRRLLWAREY